MPRRVELRLRRIATLVCVIAPFTFKNGRGTTRGLVLETANVQVVGVGAIDFRAENLGRPHIMRFGSSALY